MKLLVVALLAVVSLVGSTVSAGASRYVPRHDYRAGMAYVCSAELAQVKRGTLAIEVVFDPGAVCTRQGFIVIRQRLVDCGGYARIVWVGPPAMGARCR